VHQRPVRKRLRYPGHDYRAPCCVHVTICTHNRQRLFGSVDAGAVHLGDAGQMALRALQAIHDEGAGIGLDAHIVMPDHLHAIIILGTHPGVDTTVSVSDVVRDFKTRVQRSWPAGVRRGQWPAYDGRLWQRSFNDVLIEHPGHLDRTREYILANPDRWTERHQALST
jgi:REP element-mobilizing transposase RayT